MFPFVTLQYVKTVTFFLFSSLQNIWIEEKHMMIQSFSSPSCWLPHFLICARFSRLQQRADAWIIPWGSLPRETDRDHCMSFLQLSGQSVGHLICWCHSNHNLVLTTRFGGSSWLLLLLLLFLILMMMIFISLSLSWYRLGCLWSDVIREFDLIWGGGEFRKLKMGSPLKTLVVCHMCCNLNLRL